MKPNKYFKVWTVDAFTDQTFKGNPAAVCILKEFPEDSLCIEIAKEINLSETAFLVKLSEQHYHIRWFTPKVEVKLCGHATLAASHILWQEELISTTCTLKLNSLSGELYVTQTKEGITLNFPAQEVSKVDRLSYNFADIVNQEPVFIGKAGNVVLIELENSRDIYTLNPDIEKLKKTNCRGLIVTAKENKGYDFVSRYFAPSVGVNEDPVTGSAHCKLATYWAKKLNKTKFKAYQASSRGGVLLLELANDRVLITGKAVTVLKGKLYV